MSLVDIIAGVKALPELHTISASSMAKIGGTICFSLNPSATLAPVLTTCEQPENNKLVSATTATPWPIFWTCDIFLSSICIIVCVHADKHSRSIFRRKEYLL